MSDAERFALLARLRINFASGDNIRVLIMLGGRLNSRVHVQAMLGSFVITDFTAPKVCLIFCEISFAAFPIFEFSRTLLDTFF